MKRQIIIFAGAGKIDLEFEKVYRIILNGNV